MGRTATIALLTLATVLGSVGATATPTRAAQTPAPDAGDLIDGSGGVFMPDAFIRDLIERAQRALSALGLYGGPVSGAIDPLLIKAVRAFQRRNGLPDAPVIGEELVGRLEAAVNIESLLDRLDEARRREAESARAALLANPETRDLLTPDPDKTADPRRDASACFAAPSEQCLLDEAAESAKAVATDGRRDWALGEILVAQVRAGLADDARLTTGRISDPRLIVVALRRVAEAEAASGRAEAALETIALIPAGDERLDAIAGVARNLSRRNLHEHALMAARLLFDESSAKPKDASHAERTGRMAEMAPVLVRGDRRARAEALLARLVLDARQMDETTERDTAFRHVLSAYLAIGEPEIAAEMIDHIQTASDRNAVLMTLANRYADQDLAEPAERAAHAVDGVRYKAVALADAAERMARAGNANAVRRLLTMAEALLGDIDLPYARDYAASRVAVVRSALDESNAVDAAAIARSIRDPRLRAGTLWRMHLHGVPGILEEAQVAVGAIAGSFNRAWLFADLAEDRARAGFPENAGRLLGRALDYAADVDAPWARARILARLSGLLMTVEPSDRP